MLFSSITFLYWFLPLVVALYFIIPRPRGSLLWRNLLLFVASIVFYAWGEPLYVLVMIAQSLVGWASGLLIDRYRGKPVVRAILVISLVIELSSLLFFKYTDFFINNLNTLFHSQLGLLALALPLGISFYTFQILSYTIDLYRGKVSVQKNPLVFATYVTLFAQLIAGPIVRYSMVEEQLTSRTHSLAGFVKGVRRFALGLGKKVLLANTFGQLVVLTQAELHGGGEQSVLFALLFLVGFSLQIYFDFSGYSDMAIGLGHMFGFTFPENFNYPYISRSLTEFWRRWHMTMSFWFRDYVYISLGGNRVGKFRHLLNILIVWMVTGFWHGAGWNFILWGLYMAIFLILEKYFLQRLLEKIPRFFSHIYLVIFIMLSWILFESSSLAQAQELFLTLFGFGSSGLAGIASLYYLKSYIVLIVVAVIGCTPLPARAIGWFRDKTGLLGKRTLTILEPLFIAAILLVVTSFLVDGSFNPFIYFRF
ncbi:MAG: MBOAT family protein [Coriobacteriia bacterium]|nr:MBOAT family protein [Coriobacteriia bacterium]